MENLIIKKRTAIIVTNYKDSHENALSAMLRKLMAFGKPLFQDGPKVVNGKYFLTEDRFNEKEQEFVKVLYLPKNFSLSLIKAVYPRHRLVGVNNAPPHVLQPEITLTSGFDYRTDNQQLIVTYLNRTHHFANTKDDGVDLVSAGTSEGKSYSFIRSWVERGAPRLLACFSKAAHLENFKSELMKFTNLTEGDMLVANGSQKISKPTTAKVTLILARTIHNSISDQIIQTVPEREKTAGSWPVIENTPTIINFIKDSKYSEIVIDEAHLEMLATLQMVLLVNVLKITLLTATANRTDPQEDRIASYIFPEEYLSIEKEKRIEVRSLMYSGGLEGDEIASCRNSYGFSNPMYHDTIRANPESFSRFMYALEKLITECREAGAGTIGIVLAASLKFINDVEAHLNTLFPELSIGQFTSNTPKMEKRLLALDMDICLTTEKSFNGSINPLNMDYLVLHGAILSPVTIEQISGRLRGADGKSCFFIDLFDSSSPTCFDAWKVRQKTFNKIAKVVHPPEPDYI